MKGPIRQVSLLAFPVVIGPPWSGEFKLGDQGTEIIGKAGKLSGGLGGVLGTLCRALHDVRDLVDVSGYFADGCRLLLGSRRDLVYLEADGIDLVQDLLQRAS